MIRNLRLLAGRALRWNANDCRWGMDQTRRQFRIWALSANGRRHLSRALEKGTSISASPRLSILMCSRQMGNRDNQLPDFMESLLSTASDISQVEMLVKIDPDDDLPFFKDLLHTYRGRLNLKFIITPRRGGYRDLHRAQAELLDLRSHSSVMVFMPSEDAVFTRPGWDADLLSAYRDSSSDAFIVTTRPLEDIMRVCGPNPIHPVPVYWLAGDDFPVISVALLKRTARVSTKYAGWTPFGNLMNVEGFMADLLGKSWVEFNRDLHIERPPFLKRRGVFSWDTSPSRTKIRSETCLAFFEYGNQRIRMEMVENLCSAAEY